MDEGLEATLKTLEQLAQASSDGKDFLSRAVTFRSCADKVPVPTGQLQKTLATDRTAVAAAIEAGLTGGHSVLVALCAYRLAYEKDTEECGGHAVVLKEQKGDEFRVVDSAFFSNRVRQVDGSMYIPKDVVIAAILQPFKSLWVSS
jgi:hypothetical protein